MVHLDALALEEVEGMRAVGRGGWQLHVGNLASTLDGRTLHHPNFAVLRGGAADAPETHGRRRICALSKFVLVTQIKRIFLVFITVGARNLAIRLL